MLHTLIDNALAITGNTKYCVSRIDFDDMDELGEPVANFDWHQFCYYLLSPGFIEKYCEIRTDYIVIPRTWSLDFGVAIYEYQLGNEEPLTNLLSKI